LLFIDLLRSRFIDYLFMFFFQLRSSTSSHKEWPLVHQPPQSRSGTRSWHWQMPSTSTGSTCRPWWNCREPDL